jgi:hypothetical protein
MAEDVKLDLLLDTYVIAHSLQGFGSVAREVEAEIVAEEDGTTYYRLQDDAQGGGAWWFKQGREGDVAWLARMHPRAGAMATAPVLARVAKCCGFQVEAWDALVATVTKQGTEVQSLILSKERFASAEAAQGWASSHDFTSGDVDETEESYRLRQFDPGDCESEPRTISLDTGVQAVVCVKRSVAKHEVLPDPMLTGRRFRVVMAEAEKQFALGVVYGADDEPDAHGDTMTADEVERAAWSAVAKGLKVGLEHEDGTTGVGVLVESYIWPAAETKIGDQVVHPGDWLAGAVFDEPTWDKIKSGELTGWSLQGWARRVD